MAEPSPTTSAASDIETAAQVDATAATTAVGGSKAKALIAYIEQHRSTDSSGSNGQPPSKFVVFSQFVRYLDLLVPALTASGISFTRLDGSMTSATRKAALQSFREDGSVIVLLISLKAGGVGLNLTSANHVLLMDPW